MTRQLRKEPTNFTRWIKVQGPDVSVLKVQGEEGEKLVKLHKGGKLAQSAAVTARNVEKLGASRVEALDKDGSILGIFDFPDRDADAEPPPPPGHIRAEGDSENVLMLKAFAHLLADAHRDSTNKLIQAVTIVTENQTLNNKHITGAMQSLERIANKLARQRLRVADLGSDDDEDEDEVKETVSDNEAAVMGMLAPMIQGAVAKYASNGAAAPTKD